MTILTPMDSSHIRDLNETSAAMVWNFSNESKAQQLRPRFAKLGIDCEAPGFCDSPAFLRAERSDPKIMEDYARYIEARAYSGAYLADAARKIAHVAETVRRAVEMDGREGACVDASGMLGRMLDKLGIWNYVAKSTLTITYPAAARIPKSYFWALDEGDFASPHAIVVAPPFGIIDVTLRYQMYSGRHKDYLPHSVVADQVDVVGWEPDDIANDELRAYLAARRIPFAGFLKQERPHMVAVMRELPARQVAVNGTSLKYVIVAIGGSAEQLEGITGYRPSGRSALEIFQSEVTPHFG